MVEVKNFHFLKRPFLTKKGRWFFVTLRGGRGGVRASVTFVTKKMFFFLKASLTSYTLIIISGVGTVESKVVVPQRQIQNGVKIQKTQTCADNIMQ